VNGMKKTINVSGERYPRMQVVYCSSAKRRTIVTITMRLLELPKGEGVR
jgi:hypothetical protein